jgi:hypothetical protein
MDEQIVAIYCLFDDLLRSLGHREDPQVRMNDAEVMTTSLVAVLYYGGNFRRACTFMEEYGYVPHMLSRSRFNRRLHRIRDFFLTLFGLLGEHWKSLNSESIYAIDSFPIPVCDNIRISRARRYQGEAYRGYIASKKRFFYGLRLHLLVTQSGQPVEFFLTVGRDNDVSVLDCYDFDLPEGAQVMADAGFTDYELEDVLATAGIELNVMRKKNSTRPIPPWEAYLRHTFRKIVETTGNEITRRFPKSIHAVTQEGFELKVVLFVLALSINAL